MFYGVWALGYGVDVQKFSEEWLSESKTLQLAILTFYGVMGYIRIYNSTSPMFLGMGDLYNCCVSSRFDVNLKKKKIHIFLFTSTFLSLSLLLLILFCIPGLS